MLEKSTTDSQIVRKEDILLLTTISMVHGRDDVPFIMKFDILGVYSYYCEVHCGASTHAVLIVI